jgi:hypothetical protein
MPIILFLGEGEMAIPEFISQLTAVLILAFPVMLIGEELIRRGNSVHESEPTGRNGS